MLGRRLISAFVIISVMLLLLRLDYLLGDAASWGRPGIVLCLLGIMLATMAAGELVHLWPTSPRKPNPVLVSMATLAMVTIGCLPAFLGASSVSSPPFSLSLTSPLAWSLAGILFAFVVTFGWEMVRYGTSNLEPATVADRLGRATLVYVYLSMLFGFLVPHRFVEDSNSIGLIALITLIATVKLSDSFAYFAGKSFGTVRIAPKLSPKKTLQGSLGALVGGCTAAAIVLFLVAPYVFGVTIDKPWWWFLIYGILVTSAGMIGDLAESLLKRDADCKDSSSWLPGLGGVLDILDSLIFAAPVSWLLWVVS